MISPNSSSPDPVLAESVRVVVLARDGLESGNPAALDRFMQQMLDDHFVLECSNGPLEVWGKP
jgi:hypothetical protein